MSENVNFHMTFPPTPAYIGRLLKIADGRVRTVAEIAEEKVSGAEFSKVDCGTVEKLERRSCTDAGISDF